MHEVKVTVTRFVDTYQPGIVECVLTDASGISHIFIEKVPIVSDQKLWIDSDYPCEGGIGCTVLERLVGQDGEPLVRIDTALPDHVESSDGKTVFVVGAREVTSVDGI